MGDILFISTLFDVFFLSVVTPYFLQALRWDSVWRARYLPLSAPFRNKDAFSHVLRWGRLRRRKLPQPHLDPNFFQGRLHAMTGHCRWIKSRSPQHHLRGASRSAVQPQSSTQSSWVPQCITAQLSPQPDLLLSSPLHMEALTPGVHLHKDLERQSPLRVSFPGNSACYAQPTCCTANTEDFTAIHFLLLISKHF